MEETLTTIVIPHKGEFPTIQIGFLNSQMSLRVFLFSKPLRS